MKQQEYFSQIDNGYASLKSSELEELLLRLEGQSVEEYGPGSSMHASMLGELGAFYRGQAMYDLSERAFSSALDILAGLGAGADYATALNNLAGTHRLMGRFEQAKAEFSECMKIYRRTVGENHLLYASALNNLSLVCLDTGEAEPALNLLSRASLILAANPSARDEYASSLCNIGALLCRLEHFDDAVARLTEAVKLFETELGKDTPHYHAALNTLGMAHYRLGSFHEAHACFLQAAEAARLLYGSGHREYIAACRHAEFALQAMEASGNSGP